MVFLHDLGVFLHFQEDKLLKRRIILQNNWATKGVYMILDDDRIKTQNGLFTEADAEQIWENTEYEDFHPELVQLMRVFKLCYPIPDTEPVQFVSPQLLAKEKPDYDWDATDNLILYYEYDFMPKGFSR